MENFQPCLGIASPRCLLNERIVLWITPICVVVSIAGRPHTQEGDWVYEISNPSRTGEVIVLVVLGVQVDFPFLILEPDIDVQLFLPHLLDRFGDGSM